MIVSKIKINLIRGKINQPSYFSIGKVKMIGEKAF